VFGCSGNIERVARLIPNPAGDLWRRVDKMLADVDGVLGRVDGTLVSVDVTLRDATDVLGEVRTLLADLHDKLELLDQVPAMATRLDDVHRIVSRLGEASA
jgi:hypothetical protein